MNITAKERPILFGGEMVRAIQDGRKSMTRRVMKPQPGFAVAEWTDPGGTVVNRADKHLTWFPRVSGPTYRLDGSHLLAACPYGRVGDRLWVRESFSLVNPLAGCEFDARPENDGVRYRATWTKSHSSGWRPSIHMPRWASRVTLEITGVKVERLQDISEADAKAEGVSPAPGTYSAEFKLQGYVDSFALLWDSLNGKAHPWASNPFVWAIAFKVLDSIGGPLA